IFLGSFHHFSDDKARHRKNQKGDESHPHIDADHHDEDTHKSGDRGDQLSHALIQARLKGINIIRHTGENFSICTALTILHGKTVDLRRNLLTHGVGHIIGDSRHQKALDKGKDRADQIQPHSLQKYHGYLFKIDSSDSLDLGHQPGKQFRGGISQDLRPYNIENSTADRKDEHNEKAVLVTFQITHQLRDSAFEVSGPFRAIHPPHTRAMHSTILTHWPIPPLTTVT